MREPVPEPPAPQEWYVDGYRRGHSLSDVLAMARWRAAFADQQEAEHLAPAWIISPDIEPEDRGVFRTGGTASALSRDFRPLYPHGDG